MSADCIDSNVFVYLFDQQDPPRQATAREVVRAGIASGRGVISFQVVQEVLNVATHKMETPLTHTDALAFLESVLVPLWRVYPSDGLYRRAMEIKARFGFGFYDSLIVAAALESGCTRLLSEDLQDGQRIESLTVVNPFGA